MRRKKVLITGATGFLGHHLADAFYRHGYEVVASARAKTDAVMAKNWVIGDIEKKDVQQTAVESCEIVVNAAGRVNKGKMDAREYAQMFRLNSDMAESLAMAAEQAGVQRFLHISSTGVYGKGAPNLCDETTECKPDDAYERSKRSGEIRLLEMLNPSMRILVVRPSNIFGEMHPWNKMLAWMKAVKSRKVFLARNPNQFFVNYVYAVDVAEAIVSLGESKNIVGGEVLNINTPENMSEFYQATARAVGVDYHVYTIPKAVLGLAAVSFDLVSRATGWSVPITKSKVHELTGQRVFSSNPLRKLCPNFPKIGLDEGLTRLAQYYCGKGLL